MKNHSSFSLVWWDGDGDLKRWSLALLVCVLVLTVQMQFPCGPDPVSASDPLNVTNAGDIASNEIHHATRRQAIIDFVMALYDDDLDVYDGDYAVFYGFLTQAPWDPRIHHNPSPDNVFDGYFVLKRLNATDLIDWSKCKNFLKSLINLDPESSFYHLPNFTIDSAPGVGTCYTAAEYYPELGLEEWVFPNEIAHFLSSLQKTDGGFGTAPFSDEIAESATMIGTAFALRTLRRLGRLDMIDQDAALNFVLSCYRDDGGFSNTPTDESLVGAVPLGIMALEALGRTDLIRTEETTNFTLQFLDNNTGDVPDHTIVTLYRILWSLDHMGTLDRVNLDAVLTWVLDCQSAQNGGFDPVPDHMDEWEEKLYFTKVATDILELLGRIDLLEENITVFHYPKHTIPDWYIELTNREFGNSTSTTTALGGGSWGLPSIDVLSVIAPFVPGLLLLTLIASPGVYIYYSERRRRRLRRLRNKKKT